MGTARDAILEAFVALERETGHEEFRLSQVVDRVLASTKDFQETTLRTYVTSVMCVDAPVHHANHTDDLVRVGRGMYRRAGLSDSLGDRRAAADRSGHRRHQRHAPRDGGEPELEWHWEGNIQASMVRHLAQLGWSIRSVADTSTRQRGVDIVAIVSDTRLLVEVKGYPSSFYARGSKRGHRKKTPASVQARVWFADLIMSSMLNSDDDPDAEIVLCMPDVPTYRSLESRVGASLDALGFGRAWVSENGTVDWSAS